MVLVDMDMDAEFARSLERCSDIVAILDTRGDAPRLELERTGAVVHRDFRLEARFGRIEIWRKSAPGAARADGENGDGYRRRWLSVGARPLRMLARGSAGE
jgi:hypothetical protein